MRYSRQMLIPEMTQAHQDHLKNTKLLMVGAGGLGAPALPYLAGAGIGTIAIVDHDVVDITNLHRQTIFKESDAGKNKAECAAAYLRALNPDITVISIAEKITPDNAGEICNGFDILLDGCDNFETKSLLNEMSIKLKMALISASVEQFNGTASIFAGSNKNSPCYHCLFPELPLDCKSCSEAGILGTVAGLSGMMQAHLTLCFLLGLGQIAPGSVVSMDFKTMRTQALTLPKNPDCQICQNHSYGAKKTPMTNNALNIPLLHPDNITDHLIIDVRTEEEVSADPIEGALHMRLDTIPARYAELPQDKPLAFACASNIRSRRAAEYLYALGYTNVCVLDRLAA